jgi:hypothetical protein
MKYLKTYNMIKETGEWSRDVDWQYVKDNPDDQSEESLWINLMWTKLDMVEGFFDYDENIFKIIDIRGYDLYQGPYAIVKIFGINYKIWNYEEDNFWIEDFPVSNTGEGMRDGFVGNNYEIENLLIDIKESGGIDTYLSSKKYNL